MLTLKIIFFFKIEELNQEATSTFVDPTASIASSQLQSSSKENENSKTKKSKNKKNKSKPKSEPPPVNDNDNIKPSDLDVNKKNPNEANDLRTTLSVENVSTLQVNIKKEPEETEDKETEDEVESLKILGARKLAEQSLKQTIVSSKPAKLEVPKPVKTSSQQNQTNQRSKSQTTNKISTMTPASTPASTVPSKPSSSARQQPQQQQVKSMQSSASLKKTLAARPAHSSIAALDDFDQPVQKSKSPLASNQINNETSNRNKRIVVPHEKLSKVMGRNNCNIKVIQEVTGALLELDDKKSLVNQDRAILIKGDNASVVKYAHELIQALINDSDIDLVNLLPLKTKQQNIKTQTSSTSKLTTPSTQPGSQTQASYNPLLGGVSLLADKSQPAKPRNFAEVVAKQPTALQPQPFISKNAKNLTVLGKNGTNTSRRHNSVSPTANTNIAKLSPLMKSTTNVAQSTSATSVPITTTNNNNNNNNNNNINSNNSNSNITNNVTNTSNNSNINSNNNTNNNVNHNNINNNNSNANKSPRPSSNISQAISSSNTSSTTNVITTPIIKLQQKLSPSPRTVISKPETTRGNFKKTKIFDF